MFRRLTYKCHFCTVCDGSGCIGELPGMGGVYGNENFRKNYEGWKVLADSLSKTDIVRDMPLIRLAPITGGVENVGYQDERAFYFDLIVAACQADIALSIGDGCPDGKIQGGIDAVNAMRRSYPDRKTAVFIKPYENKRIFERIEWVGDCAELIGIDIDAYNIVTMRNLVQLEKKDAVRLHEIQQSLNVPFAVKGIFTAEDVELVRELKPDVAVISNHGGRIETRRGSTAEFLAQYGTELRSNCGELWVDGGIRTRRDIAVAAFFGITEVMIGRPFISALCRGGVREVLREARILQGL